MKPMKRRGGRNFRYRSGRRRYRLVDRRSRALRLLLTAALCCVMALCAFQLIRYAADARRAKRASAELREIYYAQPDETEVPAETPPAAEETAVPAAAEETAAADRLRAVLYPNNPYATVSSRFRKLRRQNQDIVGWLTIDGMLDEAVVQRDNAYYLTRDYRGYHNANGAIFLEETCALDTRPYTLLLYGHNMKTGAMFGGLRNYETLRYYKANPFITFDTAYEEGEYVIFAAGTVSVTPGNTDSVNVAALSSASISQRTEALEALLRCSVYQNAPDVCAEDQILVLMTCASDDSERRIVAARRLREGETREDVEAAVESVRKR